MRFALVLHLVAVAVGLSLAYSVGLAPQEEKTRGAERTLLDGSLNDLSLVSFVTAEGSVSVTPRDEGGERTWAVEMVRDVTLPPETKRDRPDAGLASDGGTPTEKRMTRRFVFPAGRPVTRMLEKLAPLVVKRTIEDVPQERLVAMGFVEGDSKRLKVTLNGQTQTLTVGGKTYGGGQRYVRDDAGRIHLAPEAIFRGLEGTETRLSERRIIALDVDEITQVLVSVGDKSRAFVHRDREQPKKRFFADEQTPDDKSDEAAAIVSDLRRLRARAWLLPDEVDLVDRELLATFTIRRHEAGEMSGKVFSAKKEFALIQIGGWSAHVTEGMAKALVDDMNAALP